MGIMEKLMEEMVVTKSEENGRIRLTYCHPPTKDRSGEGFPTNSHLPKSVGGLTSHLITNSGEINSHLPKSVGGLTSHLPKNELGYVVYERRRSIGINKPIQQEYYVMVECEMGGVIEYMNDLGVITDGDMIKVSMLIRNHSLSKVQDLHL
jgi:hypothetical protein